MAGHLHYSHRTRKKFPRVTTVSKPGAYEAAWAEQFCGFSVSASSSRLWEHLPSYGLRFETAETRVPHPLFLDLMFRYESSHRSVFHGLCSECRTLDASLSLRRAGW